MAQDTYELVLNTYGDGPLEDEYKGTMTIKRYYIKGIRQYVEETEITIKDLDDALALYKVFNELADRIESLEGEVAGLSEETAGDIDDTPNGEGGPGSDSYFSFRD